MIPDIIKFFNGGGIPIFQIPSMRLGERYKITQGAEIKNDGSNNFISYPATHEFDYENNISRSISQGPNGQIDTVITRNFKPNAFNDRQKFVSPSTRSSRYNSMDKNTWDSINTNFDTLKSLTARFGK